MWHQMKRKKKKENAKGTYYFTIKKKKLLMLYMVIDKRKCYVSDRTRQDLVKICYINRL